MGAPEAYRLQLSAYRISQLAGAGGGIWKPGVDALRAFSSADMSSTMPSKSGDDR